MEFHVDFHVFNLTSHMSLYIMGEKHSLCHSGEQACSVGGIK